jgi:glycosyltransferase involved in cell wall biosynthesis
MKALVLTTSYPVRPRSLSGAFVRDLLRGLVELGWHFEVITPAAAGPGSPPADPGIEVREVSYAGQRLRGGLAHSRGIPDGLSAEPWKWALAPALVRSMICAAEQRLAQTGFDLLWSHWLIPAGAIGAWLARRHRIPHLATAHGADVSWLERMVRVPGAARVLASLWSDSTLVAPAARTARRVGGALARPDVGVCALPAAVSPCEPRAFPPRLLFLGRFEPIKGPDLLLQSLALLPAGLFGDVTLAGAGSLEAALRERAARLPMPARFAGVLEGAPKARALVESHALVVPSRRLRDGRAEGLPHVALEALAAGRPVIAPREGALADLVAESGAGVLYDAPAHDEGRVRALAGALHDLGTRPEALARLSARARSAGAAFRPPHALVPWQQRLSLCAGARA